MKIKSEILAKVNNPQSRTKIATDLGVGEQTIAYQMRVNADDGRLTKMDALKAIAKESGVDVSEILEQEVTTNEG